MGVYEVVSACTRNIDWIQQVQNKQQWQVLLITVINQRFQLEIKNILNIGESIVFSRRTLLQGHSFKAVHSQLKRRNRAERERRESL